MPATIKEAPINDTSNNRGVEKTELNNDGNKDLESSHRNNRNGNQNPSQQHSRAAFSQPLQQNASAQHSPHLPAPAVSSAGLQQKPQPFGGPDPSAGFGAKIDSDLVNLANENRVIVNVGGIRHETYKVSQVSN